MVILLSRKPLTSRIPNVQLLTKKYNELLLPCIVLYVVVLVPLSRVSNATMHSRYY